VPIVSGGKLRLRFKRSTSTWEAQTGRDSADGQAMSLAKHMLAYPVAYTALIVPIAICRFLEWTGYDVPFELTIFADTVFLLSGLVNVVLFTTTRKIIPARDARALFSRSKSPSASDIESQSSTASTVNPFIVAEKASLSPVVPKTPSQMAAVPVSLPVPAMRDLRPGKMTVPKRGRGVSIAPTVASVYSQKSAVLPLAPAKKGKKTKIHRAIIAPLKVVKKSSQRGRDDDWSDGSSSRYSASSFGSTAPLHHSPPLNSQSSSHQAQGTRF